MLTNAGGGYSRRQQLALTRWREDITTDAWGSFIFVRDLDNGEVWSTAHQPIGPRGRGVRGDVLARPRGLAARGRRTRDPHRDRRLARRRRRTAARVDHQPQSPGAQPRPDQLRRGRARAGRRRPRASGVQQPLHRDQGHPGVRRADLHAPAAVGHRPRLPVPRAQWPRPHRRRHRVRNRPRPLHRTRPYAGQSRGAQRQRTALEYDRRRARPDRQPAAGDPPAARRHGAPVVHDRLCRQRGWRAAPDREVSTTAARSRARIALASTHAQIELRHLGLTVEDTMRFQRLAGRLLYGDPRLRSPESRVAEPARPAGAVEVRHLRRPADRARDDRRWLAAASS